VSWYERAACRGMPVSLFFPERGTTWNSPDLLVAKSFCASCEVREECLRAAAERKDDWDTGVWGGTTGTERRRLGRNNYRRRAASAA